MDRITANYIVFRQPFLYFNRKPYVTIWLIDNVWLKYLYSKPTNWSPLKLPLTKLEQPDMMTHWKGEYIYPWTDGRHKSSIHSSAMQKRPCLTVFYNNISNVMLRRTCVLKSSCQWRRHRTRQRLGWGRVGGCWVCRNLCGVWCEVSSSCGDSRSWLHTSASCRKHRF